jgi:NitT/TauT family transport system ATP-binding protein
VLFVTHAIDEALVLGDRVLVMSSTPGRFKAEILVPFGRPRRSYELQRDPLFGELSYQIWETLRDEVNAARAAELQ